jgi:hypothetical protein
MPSAQRTKLLAHGALVSSAASGDVLSTHGCAPRESLHVPSAHRRNSGGHDGTGRH